MAMGVSFGLLGDDEAGTLAAAERVGYPVLVKLAGGGIGMLAAHHSA